MAKTSKNAPLNNTPPAAALPPGMSLMMTEAHAAKLAAQAIAAANGEDEGPREPSALEKSAAKAVAKFANVKHLDIKDFGTNYFFPLLGRIVEAITAHDIDIENIMEDMETLAEGGGASDEVLDAAFEALDTSKNTLLLLTSLFDEVLVVAGFGADGSKAPPELRSKIVQMGPTIVKTMGVITSAIEAIEAADEAADDEADEGADDDKDSDETDQNPAGRSPIATVGASRSVAVAAAPVVAPVAAPGTSIESGDTGIVAGVAIDPAAGASSGSDSAA